MTDPDRADRAFLSSDHLFHAFKDHGYAFRCDTRDPGSVTKYGFRRAWEFAPPEAVKDALPSPGRDGNGDAP